MRSQELPVRSAGNRVKSEENDGQRVKERKEKEGTRDKITRSDTSMILHDVSGRKNHRRDDKRATVL